MKSLSKVIKSYQYDSCIFGSKAFGCPSECSPAEELSAWEASENAKQIIERARDYELRTQSEAIAKSREEYERAHRHGYSDGFEKEGRELGYQEGKKTGYEEGVGQAEAESRRALDELSRLIGTVEGSKTDILRRFEGRIEGLAFDMAKAILKRELSLNEETLRSIIVTATDSYRNQAWVRIRVSERDAEALIRTDGGLAKALKNVSDCVKVIPVAEMDDGSCVIEMPDQVIDAGMDTQLRNLEAAVEASGQNRAG